MNRPRWLRMREATAASTEPSLQRAGANEAGVTADADADYDKDGVYRDCPDCAAGMKPDGSQCPTCKGAGVLNGPVRESEASKRIAALDAALGARLREAAGATISSTFAPMTAKDGGYEVVLIREGLGNSDDGRWYTRHAVQELVASGVCEGMQAYADHPSLDEEEFLPERSVRDMVGSYSSVHLAESSNGLAEARAVFTPVKGKGYEWVESLAEAAVGNRSGKPLVGISLYGAAAGEDRERPDGTFGPMADLIRPSSGDIVTNAGAGGEFVRRLMESARAKRAQNNEPEGGAMKLAEWKAKMQESAKKLREAGTDEDRTKAAAELETVAGTEIEAPAATLDGLTEDKLKESQPTLYQKIRESAKAEVPKPQPGTTDEKDARITELEGKLAESETQRTALDGKLRESTKENADTKVALVGVRVMREAKIAAEDADYYLAKFREAGAATEDAMKAVITAEQAREARIVARVRESAGLDFVEGNPGTAGAPGDGLLDLSGAGVPMVEASADKDKAGAAA